MSWLERFKTHVRAFATNQGAECGGCVTQKSPQLSACHTATPATPKKVIAKSLFEAERCLAAFASEAGFDWKALNQPGWIGPEDIAEVARLWDSYTDRDAVLRCYVRSVGMRQKVSCRGRMFERAGCDCAGKCRAITC
jgi:nucleoside-diphosphate-sugar epimerase